jgi:uncharacterized protein YkwD
MKLSAIYFLLPLIIFISCSKEKQSSSAQEYYTIDLNLALKTDWEMANHINLLINEHRDSLGLPIIEIDNQYASAFAVKHTEYMIEIGRINHDNFNHRSEALKIKGAKSVGENVAYGYTTAEDVVFAWLHSPSHKSIIEGSYTHAGFGVLKNDDGRYFFTQIFFK